MSDFVPMENGAFPPRNVAYTGTAGTIATPWRRAGAVSVWVWTTTDAYVVVGNGTVATTSVGTPIPAYTPVILPVPDGGETWTVSAIQISAGGTMYCKPVQA